MPALAVLTHVHTSRERWREREGERVREIERGGVREEKGVGRADQD